MLSSLCLVFLATLLYANMLVLQVVVDRVCDDVPLAIYAILINQVCTDICAAGYGWA